MATAVATAVKQHQALGMSNNVAAAVSNNNDNDVSSRPMAADHKQNSI